MIGRIISRALSLRSIRHFRGHGIHSPFIYNMVRGAFMSRRIEGRGLLFRQLLEHGIDTHTARQLNNMYEYCPLDGYLLPGQWSARSTAPGYPLLVIAMAGKRYCYDTHFLSDALATGSSVAVLYHYQADRKLRHWVKEMRSGTYMSIDKKRFFVVFGNSGLPGQHFKL